MLAANLLIRLAEPGETFHQWNHGRVCDGERVAAQTFQAHPGTAVLNAYRGGRLVASASMTVADLDRTVESSEYCDGDPSHGPFFHPAVEDDTHFLLLHSLWVHPAERGNGIGAQMCDHIADLGLPAYAEFAEPWVGEWFRRAYDPGHFFAMSTYLDLRCDWEEPEALSCSDTQTAHVVFALSDPGDCWGDLHDQPGELRALLTETLTAAIAASVDSDPYENEPAPPDELERRGFRLRSLAVAGEPDTGMLAACELEVTGRSQMLAHATFLRFLATLDHTPVSGLDDAMRALADELSRRLYTAEVTVADGVVDAPLASVAS